MIEYSELSEEAKARIDELRGQTNIVGLSGGKDSMATCILMHRLGIPFKTVTAEVWWKEGITGENPKHYNFIHYKAVPKLQEWGVECFFLRSEKTAYDYMTTPIVASKKHPEREGKLRGFPLCGACGIQRDCKTRPCEKFYKKLPQPYNVITGIAFDEVNRLSSNANNGRISILELLEVSEFETYGICNREGLLSPTYGFSERGGVLVLPKPENSGARTTLQGTQGTLGPAYGNTRYAE